MPTAKQTVKRLEQARARKLRETALNKSYDFHKLKKDQREMRIVARAKMRETQAPSKNKTEQQRLE